VFYPGAAGRRSRFDELAYYAERFDAVEVNSTFYRVPAANVTHGWARRTPPQFEFAVKLFQKFTHPAVFARAHTGADLAVGQPDVDEFRAAVDPLAMAGKLGPLLAQFPPSFRAAPDAMDYLRWLLSAFREFPMAIELRHRSWSEARADTTALLADYQAAWVVIDEPKFRLSIEQDFRPNVPSIGYMRFHGRNAERWWRHDASEDRYDYLYTADELEPFAEAAIAARRVVKKLYMFMNNHFESKAVANAVMLKSRLGLPISGDFTETFLDRFPALRTLVPAQRSDTPRLI
jgi:uncharacterized protein YecE (DUF72 family)